MRGGGVSAWKGEGTQRKIRIPFRAEKGDRIKALGDFRGQGGVAVDKRGVRGRG